MAFDRLHHMQLAMPRGEESAARAFFVDVLGMVEV
jgi:catechol 2,3-dioxygenase-like lactoylglutathione lyase family enzyme